MALVLTGGKATTRILNNASYLSSHFTRNIYIPPKKIPRGILNTVVKYTEGVVLPPNGVGFNVYNRNPRNLERLRLALKPLGWDLEKEGKQFWHKLIVNQNHSGVTVSVLHMSNQIVLSASSNEWCIRKFLYRSNDKNAYFNVGRVFARRCLEAGLTEMMCTYQTDQSNKLEILLREIENGGVSLTEPDVLFYENPYTKERPEYPWEVLE